MSDELHYYVISEDEYEAYASTIVASKKKYTFDDFKSLLKLVDSKLKEKHDPFCSYFKDPQVGMGGIVKELCTNHGFIEIEPVYECHTLSSSYHESELDFREL